MDHLKFAQYCHTPPERKMDAKRLELLEKIDVSYCIPNISPKMRHWIIWPGYTTLHVAADKSDINLVRELIKRGADVSKQGTENGVSPIHLVVNKILQADQPMIETFNQTKDFELINVLLSAHVMTNNAANPKCKNGFSHFHIACIVDHTDAIEFFLKAGESVDQIVASTTHSFKGWTPLHLAIQFLSTNTFKILLAHGANIHLTDAEGTSPLHLLIKRLIDVTEFTTMGSRTLRCGYEKEMKKVEWMISLVLETKLVHMHFSDDTEFTALHAACMSKDVSIVEDFLAKGADIEKAVNDKSKLWPGWTPLHFAACSSIDVFKCLVKNGANVCAMNSQGETPLDFCVMRFAPKVLNSILSMKENLNNIMLSDDLTKLSDLLMAMNEKDSFAEYLQQLSDVRISVAKNSPLWPGYSLLHLSVVMNEKTKGLDLFPEAYTIQIGEDNTPPEEYNCTKSEEAIYLERIEMCVAQGFSLSIKNAEGLSPIHLAFKLQKKTALEFLLNKCEEDAVDPDDLSHLHIACVTNKLDLVRKLLNKGSNVNSPIKRCFNLTEIKMLPSADMPVLKPTICEILIRVNSTALHIAVAMENVAMAECLLQAGADVYARDDLGRTPIHLSLENFHPHIALLFLKAIPNLANYISQNGSSHLHVAAFANEPIALQNILRAGAFVDQAIERNSKFAGETPLHVAIKMGSINAATCLLVQGNANVHAAHLTKKFSSPLQYAMNKYNHITMSWIVKKLKDEGRYGVGAIDESGVTLLHLACAVCDYFMAKELLECGADPNAPIRNDEEYNGNWKGKRPLHVLVCETATAGIQPNIIHLATLLLRYGADVTLNDGDQTPVHIVYHINRYNSFLIDDDHAGNAKGTILAVWDVLMKRQKSYDVNPIDGFGISHFHIACMRNNLEVMKKFVNAGVDVNEMVSPFASNNAGKTPLHLALTRGHREAALFLIENGADVQAEDANGNTPLHVLTSGAMNLELVDVLLAHGADINAKNLSPRTPFGCYVGKLHNTLTLENLKFFLSRGCKIDLFETGPYDNGVIGQIMTIANPGEVQLVFDTLVAACNLEEAIKKGFNAISSLVAIHKHDLFTLEDYLKKIEHLLEMGCDIDCEGERGETALHEAAHFKNIEALEALLLLGADINRANTRRYFIFSIHELEIYRMHEAMQVTKLLADHIWKMKLTNLKVDERIAIGPPRGFEILFPLDDEMMQRFQRELFEMENTYISISLTVKDFLSDLGAVASYPRMLAVRRQEVDEYFKNRAYLRERFPEYCGLLLAQYKKLRHRLELLQPARNALDLLCPVELPHLCLETILRYLKNDELEILARCIITKY